MLRTSIQNILCPWVLYQRTCQAECNETGRCKCTRERGSCDGICDPECGTTIVTMIDIVPRRKWVSANLGYYYVLQPPRELSHGPTCVETLVQLLRQKVPVVLNLYLFHNQVRFFESHDLLVSGYGVGAEKKGTRRKHDGVTSDMSLVHARPSTLIDGDTFVNTMRAAADGIASRHVVFPSRRGSRQERGHCVLAIGYFVHDGVPYLKCRNHFGRRWAYNGDFSMAMRDVDEEQVHKMVYFLPEDVSVQVFRPFE